MKPLLLIQKLHVVVFAVMCLTLCTALKAQSSTFSLFATTATANLQAIALDPSGNLWVTNSNDIGTINSVTKFSPTGATLLTIPFASYVSCITADPSGNIWVGQNGNAVKISPTGTILGTFGLSAIYALAADKNGNIWVGSTGKFYKLGPSGNVLFTASPITGSYSGIAIDNVNGYVWFATQGYAALKYDFNGTQVGNYALTIAGNSIGIDAAQNAYVGGTDGTVSKITAAGQVVNRYVSSINWVTAGGSVGRVMLVDGTGIVYAQATLGGNIYKATATSSTTSSQSLYANSNFSGSSTSMAMAQDYKGYIYAGTYNGTIFRDSKLTALLPITLTSFTGTIKNGEAILNWVSATETNFSYFVVERSADGQNFIAIDSVKAKGSNSTYNYTDNMASGQLYYRLKMVDIDGALKYSGIAVLKLNNGAVAATTVFPNPSKGTVMVTVDKTLLNTNASLYNSSGVQLKKIPINQTSFNLDMMGYAEGMYFLGTANGERIKIIKH